LRDWVYECRPAAPGVTAALAIATGSMSADPQRPA
jgi:hypothetical protein